MKQHKFSLIQVILLVGLLAAAHTTVTACGCQPASDCRTYMRSKAIFLAVASEVIEDPVEATTRITFKEQKSFKGATTENTRKLTFHSGTCRKPFKQGEVYLVFQENQPIQSICNRTALAAEVAPTLDFLKQIESGNFREQLTAVITGLSADEMNKAEIWVNDYKDSLEPLSPQVAELSFGQPKSTKAQVRMRFPFRAEVRATDGLVVLTPAMKVYSEGETTTVEYEVDLACVVCDSRRIELIR